MSESNGVTVSWISSGLKSDCSSHIWGVSHDRERYICINCETSPGSKEAQEVCLAAPIATIQEG